MSDGQPVPLLTHVALKCENLDPTIEFYRRWCGLEVLHRRDAINPDGPGTIRVAWLGRPKPTGGNPEFVLVFLESRKAAGPTSLFDHLGFAVESRAAVDALAARGQSEGILHWPAVDRGPDAGYLCAVHDPDGNVVEFSFGQKLGGTTGMKSSK